MKNICITFLHFVVITAMINCQSILASDITIATVHTSNRGFVDKNGVTKGSSYDIVNHIATTAGLTYDNNLVPFGRILSDLESGQVDLALLVPNETVNKVAIPIIYIQDVRFIVVGKVGTKLNSLDDIENKIVGYLRQSPSADALIGHLNIKKVDASMYTHMIEMLMRNRIDFVFGAESSIYWALQELNYSPNQLGTPLVLHKSEMHLVYSKRSANEQTIAALIKSAKKLKEDNVIQAIINKYNYSYTIAE